MELDGVAFNDNPILELSDVALPRRISFSGDARFASGQILPVSVTAWPLTSIEAPTPYRSESLVDVTGARFIMSMPASAPTLSGSQQAIVYRLLFQPDESDRYPPWKLDAFQPPNNGDRVSFDLPAPDTMIELSGSIQLDESFGSPVSGMTVFAVNTEGETVSSTTESDASGEFTLHFWPRMASTQVTIHARRTARSGPLPDLRQSFVLADEGMNNPAVKLVVGRLDAVQRFTGVVLGPEPIQGTTLRFVGDIGDGLYRVDVGETDETGRFEVMLYPGDYEVEIRPPLESRYRLSLIRLLVEDGAELELRPQRRVPVTGLVQGSDGEGLGSARITAILRSASFASPDLRRESQLTPARTQHAQTGPAGAFAVQLDPGEHELYVQPPPLSGLAAIRRRFSVPALDTVLTDVNIQFPPASAIRVRVIDSDAGALTGVRVEAYRTDVDPPQKVGEARSDDDGNVLLRIPAEE